MGVVQTMAPLARFRAYTTLDPSFTPCTKMRSPRMASDPYPSPRFEMDQSFGGPPAGQDLRRPVSLERLVRSGPCHCGQSGSTDAPRSASEAEEIARVQKRRRFMRSSFSSVCFHCTAVRWAWPDDCTLRLRSIGNRMQAAVPSLNPGLPGLRGLCQPFTPVPSAASLYLTQFIDRIVVYRQGQ